MVLEGASKPGAKILISGGGRCNVTNTVVTEADFWGGKSTIVRRILRTFPADQAAQFFRELGVPLHAEADGKLFPDSNRARDVLDALLGELDACGAVLCTDHRVHAVTRDASMFALTTSHDTLRAHAVVLACGGRSVPKTGSDGAGYAIAERLGHAIVPTTPALAPLLLGDARPRALSGVSHEAELTIRVDNVQTLRLTGSLLWTHFGISGPVAMNASRHWARATLEGKTVAITVSFCPGQSFDEVDARLARLAHDRPKASVLTAVSSFLPASVSAVILYRVELDPEAALAHLSRNDRRRVTHALTESPLTVTDTRGYNFAEVTAGGVSLAEIDPASMESRTCPGLYLVGEILDVDGRIGGFNFQWSWSTAAVAARSLALR